MSLFIGRVLYRGKTPCRVGIQSEIQDFNRQRLLLFILARRNFMTWFLCLGLFFPPLIAVFRTTWLILEGHWVSLIVQPLTLTYGLCKNHDHWVKHIRIYMECVRAFLGNLHQTKVIGPWENGQLLIEVSSNYFSYNPSTPQSSS